MRLRLTVTAVALAAALPMVAAAAEDPGATWADKANAAVALYRGHDLAQAATAFEAALAVAEQNFPPDDPRIVISLLNLGSAYQDLKRFDEAIAVVERAAKLQQQYANPDAGDLAEIELQLGDIYRDAGRYEGAATAYRAVIGLMAAESELITPTRMFVHQDLARVLFQAGKGDEAVNEYEMLMAALTEQYGPEHISLSKALTGYARLLQDMGRTADAEAAFARSMEIAEAWEANEV